MKNATSQFKDGLVGGNPLKMFFSMYLEVGEAGSFSSNNLCKLGCGDLCQIYGIRNKDQVHVIPNHGFRGKEKCCKEYGLFNMYLLEFPKKSINKNHDDFDS